MMVSRFDEACCGICARSAIGIGYAPPPAAHKPILWLCDDPDCLSLAVQGYAMKQDTFTGREEEAKREGGMAGAAYLEQIGKYDLTTMNEPEWNEFLRRIVGGYRVALKNAVRDEAPF